MSCLPFSANSGQYFATGAKAIDQAAVDGDQRRERGECLGAREEVDDRVFAPGDRLRAVGMTTPDVDDELAVDVERDGGAEFLALGDLLGQRVGDLSRSGYRSARARRRSSGNHAPGIVDAGPLKFDRHAVQVRQMSRVAGVAFACMFTRDAGRNRMRKIGMALAIARTDVGFGGHRPDRRTPRRTRVTPPCTPSPRCQQGRRCRCWIATGRPATWAAAPAGSGATAGAAGPATPADDHRLEDAVMKVRTMAGGFERRR